MGTFFHCEPAFEGALRAAGLLDFDFLMKAAGGDSTSRHAHRETIPLDIAVDGELKRFFLKRVFRVPPKHALAPVLRFQTAESQPLAEWNILGELQKAGISAMRRIAVGERSTIGIPKQALLLVEAAPYPHTLEEWLVPGFPKPRQLDARDRHRLIYEFGRFIGQMHDRGFRWPDLHPKHVFAGATDDSHGDRWRFCLIDVERMTRTDSGPLHDDAASRDLKRLRRNMAPLPMSATVLRLFAAGYSQDRRRAAHPAATRLGRLIRPDSSPRLPDDYEHPRAIPLQRLKRIYLDARVAAQFTALGWKTVADIFDYHGGRNLRKPGLQSYRDRIRLSLSEGNGRTPVYYLKRYHQPPFAEQLRRMREFRPTRSTAAREMHFVKRLAQLGIPSLRFVAFGQEMSGIWERRSFALTAELDGTSLERLVDQWNTDPSSLPTLHERREIIRQLGLLVRQLHAHNLYHRDLYLAHVFLTRNADGAIVLRLIDLARMIERPWNPHRWAIKDLAALAFSSHDAPITRSDRVRFLNHYLDDRPPGEKKQVVRRFLREIEAKMNRMSKHDQRRTARLTGTTVA